MATAPKNAFPFRGRVRTPGKQSSGLFSVRTGRLGPGEGDRLRWWGTPEMIPLSLIPTRGAACRREPLERARSNRRSHGGPAPAAGTLEYRKRKRTSVACRACRGRSRGARSCFKRSSGFARHAAKKNVPRFPLDIFPKETVERDFLGGLHRNPHAPRYRLTARRQPQRGLPVWPMGQTADVGNRRLTNAAP